MTRRVVACTVLLSALACGSRESRMANNLSQRSTTPEQKRLWQEAADQKQAPGLTNLDQGSQPVQARQLSTASSQTIPPQGTGLVASNVKTAVRIVETAGLPSGEYGGLAIVKSINANGEQLVLDLGNNRSVALQARLNGNPLSLLPNATVSIDYRVRNDESNRRQIFALTGPNGVGVARITETGSMPITVTVPLLLLEAKQTVPPSGRGRGLAQAVIDVRVGAAQQTLTSGESAQVGGVTVTVLASRSPTGTPVDRRIEGGAYSLELIAWR